MKIQLILFISFLFLHVSAQKGITVSGRLLDEQGTALSGATVSLYTKDSLLLKGVITDGKGNFKIAGIKKDSYVLKCAFIGYKPAEIRIMNAIDPIEMGNISLQEEKVQLQNIEVVGNQQVRKVDRLLIYPSREQVKIASTSLDLLSEMMLPDLLVNPMERNISASGQSVELRVNGRKVKLSEIEALSPRDVLRVEYIDRPGVEYSGEIGAVINYITKQNLKGTSSLVNLMNATFTGFGNDEFSVKWNHRKMEIGLNYSLSYRKYSKRRTDKNETYRTPDGISIVRDWIGKPTPFRSQVHRLNLSYSLSDPKRYLLSAIVRFESRYLKRRYLAFEAADPSLLTSSKDKNQSLLPELDLYYARKFSAKQDLNVNIVGGYADTRYNRFYEENKTEEIYTTYSRIDGYRYTLIGELKYNYHLGRRLKLSAGLLTTNFWERNTYRDKQQKIKVDNSFTNFYLQLTGGWKRLEYNAGIATSLNHYSEKGCDVHFWSVRPSVDLKYKITKFSGLEYIFQTNSFDPDVAYLNNLTESVNIYAVIQGNPGLTPYRNYVNRLFYFWRSKQMNVQLNASHIYFDRPVMDYIYYDAPATQWVTSYKNQGSIQRSYASVNLKYGPFLHHIVTLMAAGEYVHFRSEGDEYKHTLDNFSFKFQGRFQYKDFSLTLMANTRSKSLWGEKVSYNEVLSSALVQYTKGNYQMGVGMYYPLSKHWEAGMKSLSAVAPSRSWTTIRDNGHMLYVKLAWNFSSGRKYKAGPKVLNNRGSSSGFLTAPADK